MKKDVHRSFFLTGGGWPELKRFFSNEDFVWFEYEDIRDEKSLNFRDIKWLRSWTLSPIGVASIFYMAYRNLPDIATIYVGTLLFFEVHEKIIRPNLINDIATNLNDKYPAGMLITLSYYWIIAIPLALASLYSCYFLLRHGRRLSWNRGSWKSVEELRTSERKWFRYNFFPSITLLVLALFLANLV